MKNLCVFKSKPDAGPFQCLQFTGNAGAFARQFKGVAVDAIQGKPFSSSDGCKRLEIGDWMVVDINNMPFRVEEKDFNKYYVKSNAYIGYAIASVLKAIRKHLKARKIDREYAELFGE